MPVIATPLWAQAGPEQPPDTTHLETQLAQATGEERLDLLVELAWVDDVHPGERI